MTTYVLNEQSQLWEMLKVIAPIVAALVAAVVAAYLAYRWGSRTYLAQKEYELVRQRYLSNGIDLMAAEVEYTLGIYRHNWFLALDVLKHLRDLGPKMPQHACDAAFFVPEPQYLQIGPAHRVNSLLGDQVLWDAQQNAFVFAQHAAVFFRNDMCSAISFSLEHDPTAEQCAELYETYMAEVRKLNSEARRHHILLSKLQDVAARFERAEFTFETLGRFKDDPGLKGTLDDVRRLYAEVFEENRPYVEKIEGESQTPN